MTEEYDRPLLLGGAWRTTNSWGDLRAPFSRERLARFAIAPRELVEESIDAAARAAVEMRGLSRDQFAEGLHRIARGIGERREEFARTIALEAAKPITMARGETDRAVATFTFAAEEARRFAGEVIPVDGQPTGRGRTGWTLRIPRGIVFGISPFNFPLNLVAHKVAPALASGNAIILKPSPRTPLTALLLGEVFLTSGLPAGALQVVPMEIPEIDVVMNDDRVGMVSFTGSATVGWDLRARAPRKAVTLELGGNAPVIVDETANIEMSLERSLPSAFGYAGQVCISAQRFFVHESVAETWTVSFVERAKAMVHGDPLDERVQLSVMIDDAAAKRTEAWVSEAVGAGAKLLCGGKRDGSYYPPTVLTNVHDEMRVVSEEVFAPVATVSTFAHFDEALDAANRSKYGLQAGVFTSDQDRARRAARSLEFGGVMINDAPSFRVDNMPYGGVKQSGFGREGVRYAMEDMTELRTVIENPQ
jgi:acyl-CoA reductase-like NAD-dependent aldehyde dehydrogenase